VVLTALRGALGFLSRLPVGRTERAWAAFVATPAALPLAGYVIGGLVAVPYLAAGALPDPVVAMAYLVGVVVLTGVNHADGLADLGDAAVVHGDAERRRAVMQDTTVGVGAVLALGTGLLALALGALALAGLPPVAAVAVALAAEVGAKLGVATLVCLGDPSHEGMGATVLEPHGPRSLPAPVAVAAPALVLVVPAATAGVLAAVVAAVALGRWADTRLGGLPGDALGAANELGRVAAIHAAVAAWTLAEGVVLWTPW